MGTYLSPLQRIKRIIINAALYLESGFLDLLSSAECAENTYKPAILKYNTAVAAYISSTTTPLQGELNASYEGQQLADNSESLAVGCVTKLAEVTDACSTTYTAGGYCEPAPILAKKQCQTALPSSLFTGKTRLFVQALYGSKRTDYSAFPDPLIGDVLSVGGFLIQHNFADNLWLLTTAEYEYFFVKFKGSSLEFYSVELNSAGQQLRDAMLALPGFSELGEETRRLEAYILTTAQIGALHSTVTITGETIAGAPIAYGWHTTWNGRTADAVCLEPVAASGIYKNRHYQLTITPALAAGVYSFSCAAVQIGATADWWPIYGRNCPIYPLIAGEDSGMYPWPNAGTGNGFPVGSYDAPMYLFYDADELVVISSDYFLGTGYPVNAVISDSWTEWPEFVGGAAIRESVTAAANNVSFAYFEIKKNGSVVSRSVEAGPTRFRREIYEMAVPPYSIGAYWDNFQFSPYAWRNPGDNATFAAWMVANGYWIQINTENFEPIILTDTADYTEYAVIEMFVCNYKLSIITVPASGTNGAVFFEIPYQDCENAWHGETYTEAWANKINTFYNPGTGGVQHHFDVLIKRVMKIGGATTYSYLMSSPVGSYYVNDAAGITGTTELPPNGSISYTHINEIRTDDSVVSNAARSYNFHFSATPADFPISLEPWRSNIDASSYGYQFNFGSIISKSVEFPGQSSVGWI